MDLDNKISFLSGFTLTSLYSMPLFEAGMALVLGIIGGIGGVMGRYIVYWFKDKLKKNDGN